MIEVNQFEEVTQIRMSRVIDGVPIYWVSAYFIDGLLIDVGMLLFLVTVAAFFICR